MGTGNDSIPLTRRCHLKLKGEHSSESFSAEKKQGTEMNIKRWSPLTYATVLVLVIGTAFYGMYEPTLRAQSQQERSASIAHATALSDAFRSVAKEALPAVVSISTTGKVVTQSIEQNSPFDDPLFRRFFENDPRFRDFSVRPPTERKYRVPGGKGSGFIIDPNGIILTNNHVVRDAEEVVIRLSDGREFTATDIKSDARSDVAVVRIDVQEKLPYLRLGDDETTEVGDWVLAFGSPFGLHRTVTQGIISSKGRGLADERMRQEFIQTDAAINPGNSGGPLVNLNAEVIGINTAISTSSGGYDGVGFAIPVNLARWVSDQLVKTGTVRRGYLGIQMQEIDAQLANEFNLKVPKGVVVTDVVSDSPAQKAGITTGDVILELDGKRITSDRNIQSVAEKLPIGGSYDIVVLRNGQRRESKISVAEFPVDLTAGLQNEPSSGPSSSGTTRSGQFSDLGVNVQELNPQLAAQLNMTGETGVVITSVDPRSPAAEAGLEPGMAISRVGRRGIESLADFEQGLEEAGESGKVLLLVRVSTGNGSIARFVTVSLK